VVPGGGRAMGSNGGWHSLSSLYMLMAWPTIGKGVRRSIAVQSIAAVTKQADSTPSSDMVSGIRGGDDARIERVLEMVFGRQGRERTAAYGRLRTRVQWFGIPFHREADNMDRDGDPCTRVQARPPSGTW
jgi:hypothetical protein